MKERPILFSGPMVRALLAGRKTQTRRIVKGIDECPHGYDGVVTGTVPKESHLLGKHCFHLASGESAYIRCPYGAPGDRLWVRETFRATWAGECLDVPRIPAEDQIIYRAEAPRDVYLQKGWTPGIHMPRVACRIVLEVTGVRVEKLGTITEKDARAEGILRVGKRWATDEDQPTSDTAVRAYEDLWHSINGGWFPETWVWVIEFRRHK